MRSLSIGSDRDVSPQRKAEVEKLHLPVGADEHLVVVALKDRPAAEPQLKHVEGVVGIPRSPIEAIQEEVIARRIRRAAIACEVERVVQRQAAAPRTPGGLGQAVDAPLADQVLRRPGLELLVGPEGLAQPKGLRVDAPPLAIGDPAAVARQVCRPVQ